MPHGLLNGARACASFQAVSCIRVTQLMRKNADAELTGCVLDGALHINLVYPVTDDHPGTRISTDIVGGEQPGPSPVELVFGVLLGQTMGQHHRCAVLFIALPT